MTIFCRRIAISELNAHRPSLASPLSFNGASEPSRPIKGFRRKWSISAHLETDTHDSIARLLALPGATVILSRNRLGSGSNASVYKAQIQVPQEGDEIGTYEVAVKFPASPTEVEFYRDTYPELALLHRRHIMDAATTKLVVPGVDEPCDVLVMPIGIPLSKLAMGLSENLCTYNRVTDNPMYEAEKAGEDDAAVAERFGAFITRKLPVFGTDGRDKEQRFCAQLAALSAIHDMLMIAKARKDQGHFPTDLKLHNMLLDAVRRTLEIDVADQVAFGTASDGVVKGTIAFASPHQMIRGSELSDQALLWMVGQSALTLLLNGTPLNSLLRPEIVHADIATFQYINTCMKGSQSPDQDTLFHPLGDARLQRLFALMFTTVSPANDAHDTPHIHGTGTLAILRFVQSFIYYPQAMHTQPSVPPVFLDFEGKEQPYPTSIEEAIAALLPLRRNMLHKLNTQHPAGITLPVPQTGNEEESRTVTVYTIHDCVNYQLLCAGAIQLEEAFETDSSPKLCHEKERPLRIHATIALC